MIIGDGAVGKTALMVFGKLKEQMKIDMNVFSINTFLKSCSV